MKSLLLALLCLPVYAFAEGGLPSQPYIYVEGEGETQHEADQVTLNFELGFHDHDLAVAAKKVHAQANKVFALLGQEKIAEKDIVAESISTRLESEENVTEAEKHPVHKTYHVTREFSVLVRDIDAFPKIVDELLALDLEKFDSINAAYSNEKELTNQVREKALTDARQQADNTLKGAKMKIDSVFAISPVPFTQIRGEIFRDGNAEAAVYPAFSVNARKFDASHYRLAPITFKQKLDVIYLISSEK